MSEEKSLEARVEETKSNAEDRFGEIQGPVTDDETGEQYVHPHDLRWLEMRRLRAENTAGKLRELNQQERLAILQHEKAMLEFQKKRQELMVEMDDRVKKAAVLRDAMSDKYGVDFRRSSYDDETGKLLVPPQETEE